jgi:hypothetical protein
LTCGLCDGYAKPPKRFQPAPYQPTCGYCGEQARGEIGGKTVCKRCQEIKERAIAGGVTGDDQILLTLHRALSATARRERDEDEIETSRSKRRASLRGTERRWAKKTVQPVSPVALMEPTAEAA